MRGTTPSGRRAALRRHEHDAIADFDAECLRERPPEHDAVLPGRRSSSLPLDHAARKSADLALVLGHHAADHGARDVRAVHEHAPGPRCTARGAHSPVYAATSMRVCASPRAALEAADRRVRGHAEDALAQLVLETVHHRQHDDQHRDAEREADHRNAADERDEAVAMAASAGSARDQSIRNWRTLTRTAALRPARRAARRAG